MFLRTGLGSLILFLGMTLTCCTGPGAGTVTGTATSPVEFSTWESLGKQLPPGKNLPSEATLPPGAQPWAGTTSHHLLADRQIDAWFASLAAARPVEVFFVLSPSHWGLSTKDFSLTKGTWLVGNGRKVESDAGIASRLAESLSGGMDDQAFGPEHGVSTLVPYIHRYFPKAKVVALLYRGEAPVNQPLARKLQNALSPWFDPEGKKRNFLLVSTDFAHHGNLEGTFIKDTRTRLFFEKPGRSTWIFAGCDNRPGIYALAQLLGPTAYSTILFHTNSWDLSGESPQDITSYFFSFFCE